MFYQNERIAVLIDGVNLHSTARALGFEIDYRKLRQEFARRGQMVRLAYYTTIVESDEGSAIKPLTDWLAYNGYTVKSKPVREFPDASGRKKLKGTTNVELSVDAMALAEKIDHLVLFSGDGEYRYLVEKLQDKGLRVSMVSSLKATPPMASDDLRRQVDNFIELGDIKSVIERDLK
jgi:uncharacterized LabA/DUF88 family protein